MPSFMTNEIVTRLKKITQVALAHSQSLPLHEPLFIGNEWQYVKSCLDTRMVSCIGSYVTQFEQALQAFTGAKYVIATINGTSALHLAYLAAGVLPGDEILMPALTFVATANAAHYCGATPHFVDVSHARASIDPTSLANYLASITEAKNGITINRNTQRPIRAMCVMHTFGLPAAMQELQALCEHYHLTLIEDAAEALGSRYQQQSVGHFGRTGILSFNGNKIITTGSGGAILCDDVALSQKIRHLTTTAKKPHPWRYEHDEIGFNYRMSNLNAALGCAQLESLPYFLKQKRLLNAQYQAAFADMDGVSFLQEAQDSQSNYWLNALVLGHSIVDLRDELLDLAWDSGLQLRPVWQPLHTLPMYCDCPRMDLTITEELARSIINVPSGVVAHTYDGIFQSCL